ncbi:MMPL family transporter [Archangium violaceum]|uniref:efflux RND transporter permease subunit n=1 Tax=Archangium violaceum TaxID=83451 RepID=UPI00195014C0|nr:MMPL family transporter [Archangium violaceum]QRO02290.1 MMPL family transporter [Archangium violaceum]
MAESLRRRWYEAFIRSTLARPWRVVLAFTLLALGGALLAGRLEFRGSFVELLPKEAPEVQDLTRVAQKAGGDGYLVVRAQGVKPEALRAFSDALAKKLETLPEVRYVEHHFDVAFFQERGLLLLPTEKLQALRQDVEARLRYEKQTALAVDLLDEQDAPPDFDAIVKKYSPEAPMREYLGSADGSEVFLMVKPDGTAGDIAFAQKLVDDVKRTAAEVAQGWPGVELDYAGAFQARLEEDAVMRKDLTRAGVLSAVMAVAIILLATRRLWALAVVGVPVIFGVSLTFAVAELAIGHLNIVTGFLVAILIGLGLEYGIHLAMRYWEERREHSAAQALTEAVRGTFAGAITSALTNAAAFFVLLFAQFEAFKQFGLLAGVGVVTSVLVAYGLGPALLVLAERLRPGARKQETAHAPEAPASATPRLPGKRMPTVAITAILLSVLGFAAYSLYVSPRVGFETNMRKLKGESPAMLLDDHIVEQTGTPLNPAILLVEDLKQAQVVQQVIEEVKTRHGADSTFKQSASLNDLLPRDVPAHQEQIAALRGMLEKLPQDAQEDQRVATVKKMLEAQPYGPDEMPVEVRRRFEAMDGKGMFLLLFPSVSNHDTRELAAWASQLDEVIAGAKARGVDLAVLDSNRIAARIFSMVRGDGPFILWAAASVVFLTILISLRSFKRACLVAGPLFLGMLCLAGGMYLFDVQLNFINAVVLPNLLAIAVDNSVHLFHRYEEEGPGSLGHVVRHTGLAAVVATLSNAAGYGALLISHHAGLRSIGQIALLGVMCTFLGTTVFFPAMLALMERWKGRKREGGMVRSLEIGAPRNDEAATEPGERKSA